MYTGLNHSFKKNYLFFLNCFLFLLINQNINAQNQDSINSNLNKKNIFTFLKKNNFDINIGVQCMMYKNYSLNNRDEWPNDWVPSPLVLSERMLSGPSSDLIPSAKIHQFQRKFPQIEISIFGKNRIMNSVGCSYRAIFHHIYDNDFCEIKTETRNLNVYYEFAYLLPVKKRTVPYIGFRLHSTYVDYRFNISNSDDIWLTDFNGEIKSNMFFGSFQPSIGFKSINSKFHIDFGFNINTLTYAHGKYSYSQFMNSAEHHYPPNYENTEKTNLPVSFFFKKNQFFYDFYLNIGYRIKNKK